MLTVILTDDDRDWRGNFVLGNVVAAIVRAEFPADRCKQMDELRRSEQVRAKAIYDAPPKDRRKLSKELTGCRLLQTDKEKVDVENDTGRRAWTLRAPNRFTEERKAWSAIHAGVIAGKIHPKNEDGSTLPHDNYGHGSVTEIELTEWMRRAGYAFQAPTPTGNSAQQVVSERAATEELSEDLPARNRRNLDITKQRGTKRRILESWDDIEKLYGPNADGTQVKRVLDKVEATKPTTLKTVQNHLSELRRVKLIP